MKANIERLLFEAYRRNDMADGHEPILKRWLGLGTEAAYRPALKTGLMRFFDGQVPPPRRMGWLCLTDAGLAEMERRSATFQQQLDHLKAGPYSSSYAAHYSLAGGRTS